ncbi:coagulation factor XIII B chain-like [Rana temporaria]|uniref:coagulation factor XIII B chain-like n=1 Tax=Rana temporaria TaxID=8407 RepID=UPI001AAD70D4|nr:coagulation factor XIII B chain-like [Rana temporaria]
MYNDLILSSYSTAWCTKPIIENVYNISENKDYYNNGEEVEVRCNPGYYPSSDTMRCDNPQTSREWTPPIITCIGVTMTDWRVTSSSISVRISCTPQCPDTWRFAVECCAEPDNNGPCTTSQDKNVTFTDLQPSSQYRIETEISTDQKTYNLEPIDIRTVDSAQCEKPTIENVSSLYIDKEYYNNGDSVTVWCKSGYRPSYYTMRCDNPPEWTPPPVTCTAQCEKPTLDNVNRLSIDKGYYNKGDSVTVWCKSAYYPSAYTMTCDNPPEWTPPPVTCTGENNNTGHSHHIYSMRTQLQYV